MIKSLIGLGIALLAPAAIAVEFPDGRVAFDQPPIFAEANTPYPQVWFPSPIYNFILRVPDAAGEPLERLEIQQLPSQETLYFQPQRTRAFVGTRPRQRISLGEVVFDPDNQLLQMTFDPPVPPGTYLRVEVSPVRNPQWAGVYLFGVTAFPRGGALAIGQYIGTGRLQFYRGSNFLF
ncbi:DUF2808 domain-containing protein [Thermosynechococcaceae cyanobacterium Okahandja]